MIIATSMIEPWQQLVSQEATWGTGAAIQGLLGNMGLVILVTALTMGIFTGLNGFIISSSRLLFAMSRAKIIPGAFSKLHPKYKTPYIGIIFTVVVAAIAPWFGRQALTWVVDMSSIGVTIAYFYTCFTAFTLFKWKKIRTSIRKTCRRTMEKTIAGLGMLASVTFLGLLLIPGSPAALGIESLIALVIWIALGVAFYLANRTELNNIPKEELNYLILGSKKIEAKNRT